MQMRFKALNQFTGRLPLIDSNGRKLPMGRDTETAIRAGVLKGMEYEISGYIESMKHKYPELLVFLTGGDDFSFDSSVKSIIFADRFFNYQYISTRILLIRSHHSSHSVVSQRFGSFVQVGDRKRSLRIEPQQRIISLRCFDFSFFTLPLRPLKDKNALNLIIDIGNTAAKVALFDGGEMVEVLTESNQSLDCLEALCAKYPLYMQKG